MVPLITMGMLLVAGITGILLCYMGTRHWQEAGHRTYVPASLTGGILCLLVCVYEIFMLAVWPQIMWRTDVLSFVSAPPAWYLLVLTFGPPLVFLWAGILMLRRRHTLARDRDGKVPVLWKVCLILGILCLVCCVVEIPFSVAPTLSMFPLGM